jgi:hypothetical protein
MSIVTIVPGAAPSSIGSAWTHGPSIVPLLKELADP